MDLTGQNKLPEWATITIRNHESQAALVDFDVPLTEEQARQNVSLENDDQKTAFLKEIVFNDPDIKSKLAREMLLAYKAQESREILSGKQGNLSGCNAFLRSLSINNRT